MFTSSGITKPALVRIIHLNRESARKSLAALEVDFVVRSSFLEVRTNGQASRLQDGLLHAAAQFMGARPRREIA